MFRILLQAALFLTASAVAGVAGNALHPGGLDLGRDYFLADSAPAEPDGNADDPTRDFQMIDLARAQEYWEFSWETESESWNAGNGIYFLDARRKNSFESGHIPGAFLADPWDKEKEDILEPEFADELKNSFGVIVYCNGGDCDDSLTVAMKLKFGFQVPEELIHVYEGGFEEWKAAGLQTEQE